MINTIKLDTRDAYLSDPFGMFDIESLSMSLNVRLDLECSKVLLVTFTGTIIVKASNAIGTKIFSLQ